MSRILFPSGNANIDFVAGGSAKGWIPMDQDASNILKKLANEITATAADRKADHAIPSPVAHIKDFYEKLKNKDENAVNEWRGMLAVIALQKLNGYNISIKEIPLVRTVGGEPSVFASVVYDALLANKNITGYTEELVYLSVFCKDDKPFAMIIPGMIICPFKQYPSRIFSDVDWYDERDNKWISIIPAIKQGVNLTVTGQDLYAWLYKLNKKNVNGYLADFVKELERDVPDLGFVEIRQNRLESGEYAETHGVMDELMQVCPMPDGAPSIPWAKKMLIVVPPEDHCTDAGNALEYAYHSIKTEAEKKFFTPFVLHENGKPIYIIPPIHSSVVESLKVPDANNSDSYLVQPISWSIIDESTETSHAYVVNFSLLFVATGQVIKYTKKFTDTEIAWTASMPYISMWPFVNFKSEWKEHYVSIVPDKSFDERLLINYPRLTKNTDCTRVVGARLDGQNFPEIKISVINKSGTAPETYSCSSDYKNQTFKMLRSDSAPYALEFSYDIAGEKYSLGSWILDRRAEVTVPATGADVWVVAMDFGTTSTNVYLYKEGDKARSISSAGKFLFDVYNPHLTNATIRLNNRPASSMLQNYYLFSDKNSPMGKIFTYGQNFDVIKDGISVQDIISNVSGRVVVVDEEYINSGDANDSIQNNLKWPSNNAARNAKKDRARENFIRNILTYAVLEAKANGAGIIKIRYSYPAVNFGNAITSLIDGICSDLKNISGITNITNSGATEARAAGKYFSKYLNDKEAPNADEGYAIIDIGGGTSDFSFWKREDPNKPVEMKDEYSFGYAGKYLVTRTIIQTLDSDSFKDMWECPATRKLMVDAIEKYCKLPVNLPLGLTPDLDFDFKASSLDYILEKCPVNTPMLQKDNYADFLTAIRIKYYALFYLIAMHIKNNCGENGRIKISPYQFRICLAGCGSKGVNFCKMGNGGQDFMKNIRAMFSSALGLSADCSFDIAESKTNNKEEVVIGLAVMGDNDFVRGKAAPAANPLDALINGTKTTGSSSTANDSVATAAATQQKVTEIPGRDQCFDTYKRLVKILKIFEKVDDYNTVHLLSKIDPTVNIEAVAYFNAVYANVNAFIKQANANPETYAEHFSLMMLELMIDEFMSR